MYKLRKRVRTTYQDLENIIKGRLRNDNGTYETYGIEINNKIFTESILYLSDEVIHFTNCIFTKAFTLLGVSYDKDIYYKDCYFMEGVFFNNCSFKEKIIFLSCKVRKSFISTGGKINYLLLLLSSCDKILVGDTKCDEIQIGGVNKSLIKEIDIYSQYVNNNLQIANCIIHKLSFNHSSTKAEFEISNCWINSFTFSNFRNNGVFKLIDCKSYRILEKKSHFIINNSNLSKAEFFQFYFSSFDVISIANSILRDCVFVNTQWSNNITSILVEQVDDIGSDKLRKDKILKISKRDKDLIQMTESKNKVENEREIYRQLKYALSKQGDQINEQLFHSLELRAYFKTIRFFSRDFFTKTTIFLSYHTSNFGQSLARPVFWVFAGHFILSSIALYFGGFSPLLITSNFLDAEIFKSAFEKYFIYINPLRHTSVSLPGFLILIDLLMRIWSSYMIYNFIRASRRFIR